MVFYCMSEKRKNKSYQSKRLIFRELLHCIFCDILFCAVISERKLLEINDKLKCHPCTWIFSIDPTVGSPNNSLRHSTLKWEVLSEGKKRVFAERSLALQKCYGVFAYSIASMVYTLYTVVYSIQCTTVHYLWRCKIIKTYRSMTKYD